MLRCPTCGSRRLEVCGKISDDSGWTQCRDCGHRASPRAFVEGASPTAHRPRPLPTPTLATPALTLTCPACHTGRRFVIGEVVLTGKTIVDDGCWDIMSERHAVSVIPTTRVTCDACGATGPLEQFLTPPRRLSS